jgi:hypothetical protein
MARKEDQAKVVAEGAEDDVGGVAGAAFEKASAEMTVCFHVAYHGLDRGAAAEFTFDAAKDPGFCPEIKTRRGFCTSWPRYPLST